MNLSEYIERVGVKRIAEKLNVSAVTVYDWKNLVNAPSPENAFVLIEFSNGILDWEAIYKPIAIARIQVKNPGQGRLSQ